MCATLAFVYLVAAIPTALGSIVSIATRAFLRFALLCITYSSPNENLLVVVSQQEHLVAKSSCQSSTLSMRHVVLYGLHYA